MAPEREKLRRRALERLDAERIEATIAILSSRIGKRFPDSGLWNISQRLLEVSRGANAQAAWIRKPILTLRFLTVALIAVIVLALVGTLTSLAEPISRVSFFEFVQSLEAGINDVVLIGLGVYFLSTLERRVKRNKALKSIHELRALAHIIDMHQLTKDPDRFLWHPEESSPGDRRMTAQELTRYLDYCSELLSLVGKTAVLYVQEFDDSDALHAVNEVEDLTTGLSRKIWQKIIIMHQQTPLTT